MEEHDSLIVILSDDKNSFEPFPVKFYRGVPPKEKDRMLIDIKAEILEILDKPELNFRCLELVNFSTVQVEFSQFYEESFVTRKSFHPKEFLTTMQADKDEEVIEFVTNKRDNYFHIRSFKPSEDTINRRKREPIAEKVPSRYINTLRFKPYSAVTLIHKKRNFMTFGSNYHGDMTYGTVLRDMISPKSKSESIVTFNPLKHKGFITIQSLPNFKNTFEKLEMTPYLEKKEFVSDTEPAI